MNLERWDPHVGAISLRDAMNTLLQESFVRPGGFPTAPDAPFAPPLDVAETPDAYLIRASLPGVRPEDVEITVHGGTLTIRGESKAEEERKGERRHVRERRFGVFQRTVALAAPVRSDQAEARYEHGVLTLTLPKSEEARPRQIRIAGPAEARNGQGEGQGA